MIELRIEGKHSGVVLLDDEDADLCQLRWCITNTGKKVYVVRGLRKPIKRNIYLHRVVLNRKLGGTLKLCADHINGNSLDNRRSNLREASFGQNNANTPKQRKNASSRFKGVCWYESGKCWKVIVKDVFVGCFKNELDAARAYNETAKTVFGEFARLNDLNEDHTNVTHE